MPTPQQQHPQMMARGGTSSSRRNSAASKSTKWFKSLISRKSSSEDRCTDHDLESHSTFDGYGMDDGVEILVPSASDVVYKYTWNIRKFRHICQKRRNPTFDSEAFEVHVNGVRTRWNLSIRFWRGPDGQVVRSPVVACLNLLRAWPEPAVENPAGIQACVSFQFGVYNSLSGRYEMTPMSRTLLYLGSSRNMVSVGHQDVAILQRHIEAGDARLVCKLQVVPTGSEEERHSLSQELGALLDEVGREQIELKKGETEEEIVVEEATGGASWARGDVVLRAGGGRFLSAHRCILGVRSPRLGSMMANLPTLDDKGKPPVLELDDLTPEMLQETLRYIYSGRVENIDSLAPTLLGASCKYELPGLTTLCERSLLETMNAESVASRLLLADEFGCDTLKRGALAFLEGHSRRLPKNVAWTVMEMVNPELFQEACEAGLGDSASSFGSSLSDMGSSSR